MSVKFGHKGTNGGGVCPPILFCVGIFNKRPRTGEFSRLLAYTARYAHSVLPFVISAGIRQIKSGGADTFLTSVSEHAPASKELLKDLQIRAPFLSGYDFSVAQGKAAFSTDSELVVQGWTAAFSRAAPYPCT